MDKKQLIDAAFDHVYADTESYIRDIAREHTIANLGSSLEELVGRHGNMEPRYVIGAAFSCLANDHACEGLSLDPEYRSWLKDARRDAALVVKAGLPMTIRNARDAFEFKGPFAKKAKKVQSRKGKR